MGFDTSGGGDPEAGGGGTIFDDPQFMESLQGVLQQQPQGGGYGYGQEDQAAMYRKKRFGDRGGYDPDFGDPRRAQGMGGGGVVSAPDGTVYGGGATSPFEVGGNSGGGGDPNDPNSYQYMVRHPPSFPMDIGPGSANERAQAAWQKKLEEARLRDSGRPISAGNGYGGAQPPGGGGYGGYGGGVENTPGGMDLQDLARRFAQQNPHYGDLSWGESQMGKRAQQWNQNPGGGWYGGYGQQGGGGQQQWYRPQGPQGSSRPDPSNPGAAYDAGPGRWEAQQQAQRDQMNTQAQGPRQPQGGPQRWGMPMGGAYGRPMPMRKRRFYGNGGGPMPPGSPGAASNLGGPAYQTQGPAPTGGGYNI